MTMNMDGTMNPAGTRRKPLEWEPSTHHDVPQPAGHLCADWYKAKQPDACEILYALAHVKGEADSLRAINAYLLTALEDLLGKYTFQEQDDAMVRAAIAKAKGQK